MSIQAFLKNKQYTDLKEKYEKEYFKLHGDYAWYDGNKIVKKSVSSIAEYFKNKKITVYVEQEDDDGEIKVKKYVKSFYQVWSEDPKMKEYKEVVFNYDKSKTKEHQFNLFKGFDVERYEMVNTTDNNKLHVIKDGLNVINEHIKILCNHNMDHVKLVKWFFAHMFKHPETLPSLCLVLISKEGAGKDLLYEFIENMVGEAYTFNVDKLDGIVGKFNSTFGGKILGVVNETDPVDSQMRRDNIKYVVTAKKVEIEGKHKDPVKTNNCCRLMFFANRLTAFPIEKGSRRPFIIYCSEEKLVEKIGAKANKKYFDRLGEVINDKDVQKAFYNELMEIDVDNFNFREIDKSILHKQLEEVAKPPLAEFMGELIYDNRNKKVISMHTVEMLEKYTEYMKKRNMRYECSQKMLNVELLHTYKIVKYESNGRPRFKIDVETVKKILEKEYKIKIAENEEDKQEDKQENEEEKNCCMFIDKNDKAVYVRADEYKIMTDLVKSKDEDIYKQAKYIKELEKDGVFFTKQNFDRLKNDIVYNFAQEYANADTVQTCKTFVLYKAKNVNAVGGNASHNDCLFQAIIRGLNYNYDLLPKEIKSGEKLKQYLNITRDAKVPIEKIKEITPLLAENGISLQIDGDYKLNTEEKNININIQLEDEHYELKLENMTYIETLRDQMLKGLDRSKYDRQVYSYFEDKEKGKLYVYNGNIIETFNSTIEVRSKILYNFKTFMVKAENNEMENMKNVRDYYVTQAKLLLKKTKGKVNLLRYRNVKCCALDAFLEFYKKLNIEVDPIDKLEARWLYDFYHNGGGGMVYHENEYEGNFITIDENSAYPSTYTSTMMTPIKKPIFRNLKQKDLKTYMENGKECSSFTYGLYRCKVSYDETKNKLFKWKFKHDLYSHMDLKRAQQLGLKSHYLKVMYFLMNVLNILWI
eukprot:gene6985-7535_t